MNSPQISQRLDEETRKSLEFLTDKSSGTHLTLHDEDKTEIVSSSSLRGIHSGAIQANKTCNRPWYHSLNPLKRGAIPPVPTHRSVSGEHGANWLSQLTFQWMTPIMGIGYRRPLEMNDIWTVNPDRYITRLSHRFEASFQARIHGHDSHPLLFALHDTFWREFWLGALCVFFSSICQVMTPFVLRYLIQWVTAAYLDKAPGHDSQGFGKQIGLVFGIMGMQAVQSIGTNQFIYRGFMVGAQARSVMITAIFEKTLKLSSRARAGDTLNSENTSGERGWPPGRVMNMMSTDTSRIESACGMFHLLWVSPLTIFLALALLITNMSYSALAGFVLLFGGIPLLTITMKKLMRRRREINTVTDARLSLTQEILRSIRFVKLYSWERAFFQALRKFRQREVLMIQKLMALRNAMNAISVSLPIFASMLSFIVYSVSGHELTPSVVFSSLSIFNSLRVPFNLLPVVIGQLTDAWASLHRIEGYLLAEEHKETIIWEPQAELAIFSREASFTWEQTCTQTENEVGKSGPEAATECLDRKEGDPFTLQDINLSIRRNELVAVIGTVGSGKSSLMSALAGEMRQIGGTVTLGAARAFCPQSAWIQNATIRENILFGKNMDQKWYNRVIEACALRADFDMLPCADETEVGERGITLSGGQRQRVNIARAIYFDSPLVLLDDPLSAVDAHVAQHVFEHAICGLLHDRCRVLVTHRHDLLRRCDRIIWLDGGRIQADDSYENLMAANTNFQDLMASTNHADRDEEAVQAALPQKSVLGLKEELSDPGKLIQEEDRSVGSVSWSIYSAYLRASGSVWYGLIPLILLAVAQTSNILTNLWLSYWTDDKFNLSRAQYIGIYVGLGLIQAILMFLFSLSVSLLATWASREMMGRALASVLRAPMSFFDTTPLGRIINRFSKDVDTMDNALADAIRMYLYTLAMILSVFILLIVYFHYFGIAIGPLLILFLIAAAYYRASARDLKRHEAVLRSTVFARFSEAISGTASIRAYGSQSRFTHTLRQTIDDMNSAYYLTFSNQRWLSTRLDAISILLVATTGVLVVTLRHVVSPSISGLVFSYILAIVQMIQLLVKQFAEVENAMNATERVHFYGSNLTQEADPELHNSAPGAIDKYWPQSGAIEFNQVKMRYRPELPLVLNCLNLSVAGSERIGIVGRTGAGKSSIMTALFRLTDLASGSIKIDGIDISQIPRRELRSRLAIIPQDPTLFRGTVRSNLDPFHEHTDLELWSALRQVGLSSESDRHDPSSVHLDGPVEEEGLNFSMGQRQLMAIARALVRGSQIVVCDEATSSVDLETDSRIQETIRTRFKGRTLLCIAHRLQTIINYDRICVMDNGRIVESDTPLRLWEAGGIFRAMCTQSGLVRADFN